MIRVTWGRDVQRTRTQNKLLFIKIKVQKGLSNTLEGARLYTGTSKRPGAIWKESKGDKIKNMFTVHPLHGVRTSELHRLRVTSCF